MTIPKEQGRKLFYESQLAAFQDTMMAPSFMTAFFQRQTTAAKAVSVEVRRGTERIAVDVLRGAGSTRNTFGRFSERKYIPPFYNESFDATSMDRYDIVFGQAGSPAPATIGYLARDVAEKYAELRAKIERAREKMCAQVFETGIIELNNHENIDYKRKAASKKDLTGSPWSSASADVESHLIAAGDFIRQKGKNSAKQLNLVMSSDVWISLKKTNFFKEKANFQQVSLLDITMPQADAAGGVYHGRIVAGAYIFNLWTYDETYEDKSGNTQYYWPREQCFVTPVNGTRFDLVHAGVPAIIRDTTNAEFSQFIASQEAEFYLNNYIDEAGKSHTFEIYSAPLAIPVSVDQIYTMEVLGQAVIG